jgi:hypothetical protein
VTEQQLARMAKRRLAILHHAEEITGNVSLTCRYYGISRQCFYTWRRRHQINPRVRPVCGDHCIVGKSGKRSRQARHQALNLSSRMVFRG